MRPFLRDFAMITIIGTLFFGSGCGRGPSGPEKFPVSGKVSFQGQPVPLGTISFEPDSTQGGTGPSLNLPIQNGKYDSGSGSGTLGGPCLVQINGYDGKATTLPGGMEVPEGTPLFPTWKTTVVLPKAKHQQDFEVPKVPAKKK
jgi:hypothetical protein